MKPGWTEVTTTGYGDLKPSHWFARIFTSFFVLVGMGLLGVAAGAFANHAKNSHRPKSGSIEEQMAKELAKMKQVS